MRQADHEIELDGFPAGGKHFIHGGEQVCGGVAFVDDLTHFVRSRLGCQGKAGFTRAFDFFNQRLTQRFDPQRRQRKGNTLRVMFLHQVLNKRFNTAVVSGTERQKRYLIMAGCLKGLVRHFRNQFCISFPVRAPDHACLTKPASSGAAPGDFQYDAVMDGLHKRHNWCDRVRPGIQINGFPFFDNGFFAMHTGNINAADFRQLFDDRLSCEGLLFRGGDSGGNFRDDFFAFTNDKSVDETFKRRGIECAGPSGNNQRMILQAVIRPQRDPAHIHHVEHVRIGQFILQ